MHFFQINEQDLSKPNCSIRKPIWDRIDWHLFASASFTAVPGKLHVLTDQSVLLWSLLAHHPYKTLFWLVLVKLFLIRNAERVWNTHSMKTEFDDIIDVEMYVLWCFVKVVSTAVCESCVNKRLEYCKVLILCFLCVLNVKNKL